MSKHTPGPWHYENYGATVRAENDQMTVCDVRGFGYLCGKHDDAGLTTQEMDSNGMLMAAAPDMLDALCEAASVIECNCGLPDGGCEGSCSLGIVNAAIKKARGL